MSIPTVHIFLKNRRNERYEKLLVKLKSIIVDNLSRLLSLLKNLKSYTFKPYKNKVFTGEEIRKAEGKCDQMIKSHRTIDHFFTSKSLIYPY